MSRWMVVAGDVTPLGGMDRANHALVSALSARAGAHVEVVAHEIDAELSARPSVSWRRVPRPWGSHLLGAPLLARAGERAASLAEAGVRVMANGGNADAGDASWVHYVHAAHRPAAAGLRQRIQAPLAHTYYLRSERRALRRARVVICNSRRTAVDVQERVGVGADRVRIAYYGCDPVAFSLATAEERADAKRALGWNDDRPVALFIGALGDRRKGFDRLFDAWRRLCSDSRWDADLAVLGQGSELPAWQRRAVESGMSGRIAFLGFRTDVPRLLAAADVLVHPARYEAFGLGVHEAICRGLPAIVSASAGVAELYPADLGRLLIENVEDAGEIADRIHRWRWDPDEARRKVRPFSDRLRARTWRDMADEIAAQVAGS